MKFTKMHGAGNDFVILNLIEEPVAKEKLNVIAKKLCTPHLSLGADGLMAVVPAEQGGDYKMLFYNADGSEGEMCGNGARCICRWGYENGLAGETQHVETISGTVIGHRESRRLYTVRLNDPSVIELDHPLAVNGRTYPCAYVELGVPGLPHAVVELPELDTIDLNELRELGRTMRYDPSFPKGANVNFCKLIGEDHILERTFERGVEDFTLACGTGSGSAVTVFALKGYTGWDKVKLTVPGGELFVSVTPENGGAKDLLLTGPTNIVARGEVTDEDLIF